MQAQAISRANIGAGVTEKHGVAIYLERDLLRVGVPNVEFFVVSDRLNVQTIGRRRAMYRGTKIGQTDAAHVGKWNLQS